MRYANLIKYMNSFAPSLTGADISQRRLYELCEKLGRVNIGTRYIWLPDGSAGYAASIMLESVIKSAGYTVGRITSTGGFDSRAVVYINGEIPSIDDYNKAVTELKGVVQKMSEETYLKEEMSFVSGLLLCKMGSCEYVILQGLSGEGYSLDAVCAPYDLIVIPTVYESLQNSDRLKILCDAIKRGCREVVSGNQKSDIYNRISNACSVGGLRLYIPVKSQFELTDITSRSIGFKYGEKDGYSLKSPSLMLRDCAMTVIESALAIRRSGMKLPWSSIKTGLATATATGCFDMLSVSPKIIIDSARSADEASLVLKTADEVWGRQEKLYFCVGVGKRSELESFLAAFADRKIQGVIVVCEDEFDVEGLENASVTVCQKSREAAKLLPESCPGDALVLCFGGVDFAFGIKTELLNKMNG